MKKIFTKERIEQLASGVILLTGTVLAMILNSLMTNDDEFVSQYNAKTNNYDVYKPINYSDALEVIINSDMFDHNKSRAMSIVKLNCNSGYYKSIIAIMKSDMFDSGKLEAISNINKIAKEES